MTCRHGAGDTSCSSYRSPHEEIAVLQKEIEKQKALLKEPDNSQFEILECFELSNGLVLKVRYENCLNCSYEGTKVLVYAGRRTSDVFKWKIIDPHFSDKVPGPREAPSPTARFPASDEGWEHATHFLIRLGGEVTR